MRRGANDIPEGQQNENHLERILLCDRITKIPTPIQIVNHQIFEDSN